MKRQSLTRTARLAAPLAAFVAAVGLVLPGCTDLTEDPFSAVTADGFYQSESDYFTGLAGVYAQARSVMGAYFNLSEVTSDEVVVPTRGPDWNDGGRWIAMHRQLWDADLTDLNGAWTDAFIGVARANALLQALQSASFPEAELYRAEARFLRAFFYYELLDFFGNVPLVTEDDVVDQANPPMPTTRAEVFAFVTSELEAIRGALPARHSATGAGRATQGAADALLASLYLNAQVFTGTVTAGGLQPGQARWQDAVDAADRILNAGQYMLANDWFANFTPDNDQSPELIFVIQNLAQPDLGNTLPMTTLHYNQLQEGPWNGFSTLAETYNAFDDDDARKAMWLVGQAYSFETGEPVNNRQGQPLIFTPEIGDITNASENEGVRFNKYQPDLNNVGGSGSNDFVIFRLAEIYLIKAEALNELGRTGEAVPIVNMLRERYFEPDEPIADTGQAGVRDAILRERLFELAFEGKRRQDLIRHGKFTQNWSLKDRTAEPYRILFPIPRLQMGANPNLVQNPGY